MSKPNRKLTYPIGSVWTLGKPARAETGLGKIVKIVGSTEDFRRVVVADCEHPAKKAEVRIKNLGNKLAECDTDFDPTSYSHAANHGQTTSKPCDSATPVLKHSFIGRLLREISYDGKKVRVYRDLGLGRENVLTTEVFQALDFLPRTSFFGEVIGSSHGSTRTCALLKQEAESAEFSLLPGTNSNISLEAKNGGKTVQPDLIVKTKSVYCVVEAKGLRQSSFQRPQLAKEFVLAHTAEDKTPQQLPLLLLVLSKPPPVLVKGKGLRLQSLQDAIMDGLPDISQPDEIPAWREKIEETVSWITWFEIERIVCHRFRGMDIADPLLRASIERLVQSISDSIDRHGDTNGNRSLLTSIGSQPEMTTG